MQVVGWLPVHPLRGLALPYWVGLWFGTYATWEGLLLQAAAGAFVIGSYLAAEAMSKHKPRRAASVQPAAAARGLAPESSTPAARLEPGQAH